MPALSLPAPVRESSLPQRLLAAALFGYAIVFVLLLAFWRPGLGLGGALYLPIVLVALASGPVAGAGAGVLALVLYLAALLLTSQMSGEQILDVATGIRLATFALAGATVGYFSSRGRRLLSDSLHVLEELLLIARRDLATGVSDGGRLLDVLERLVAQRNPFALLVGELGTQDRPLSLLRDEEELRSSLALVATRLETGDELARVGASQVAVVALARDARWTRAAAAELEELLRAAGVAATFGWAVFPSEGKDVLSLFQAATAKLYARRIVREEWRPTPESAGLVVSIDSARR